MSRMPGAKWSGEHSPRRKMSRYDIVCIHTIVGYAPAPAAHFSTSGGGTIWQSRDTRYRSAANLNGNHRVISIENADHGAGFPSWSGDNVPPFTDNQIEAIAKICAWAHETHGIPLQMAPNSRSGSRGIGYHRQGIDGNWTGYDYSGRVSGGEVWTSAYGKVCPGDARIAQIPKIIARARQIVGLGNAPGTGEEEWLDMTPEQFHDELDNYFTSKRGRLAINQALTLSLNGTTAHSRELRTVVTKLVAAGVSHAIRQSATRATKMGRHLGTNLSTTLTRAGFHSTVARAVHNTPAKKSTEG